METSDLPIVIYGIKKVHRLWSWISIGVFKSFLSALQTHRLHQRKKKCGIDIDTEYSGGCCCWIYELLDCHHHFGRIKRGHCLWSKFIDIKQCGEIPLITTRLIDLNGTAWYSLTAHGDSHTPQKTLRTNIYHSWKNVFPFLSQCLLRNATSGGLLAYTIPHWIQSQLWFCLNFNQSIISLLRKVLGPGWNWVLSFSMFWVS